MKENQNLDFKKIWKDEYLKYVSGFANSEGGVLLIGVDDCGNVVGVDNAKKTFGGSAQQDRIYDRSYPGSKSA